MAERTVLWNFLDSLLDGGLEEFVRSRRAAGKSWRHIAHEVWYATGQRHPVTHEVLRRWFPDEENGEAA